MYIQKEVIKRNNGIKVLYTNADQLANKIKLLRKRCKHKEPNVIGINEVKPKKTDFRLMLPNLI